MFLYGIYKKGTPDKFIKHYPHKNTIIGLKIQRTKVIKRCILLILYGLYLFLHTFRKTMYDITYNFEEEGLRIRHVRGETVYPYDKIDDVSLITPEDPNQYNIISIRTGKETFVIPFTLKKAQCDTIYEFLMSHVTAAKIADDNSQQ